MKKKVIYISILMILMLVLILNNKNETKVYEDSNKTLGVYIQNEEGKYIKSSSIPSKESGYTFNDSNSGCDGSASVLWDNEVWGLELDNINRSDTKCYLYFDKN